MVANQKITASVLNERNRCLRYVREYREGIEELFADRRWATKTATIAQMAEVIAKRLRKIEDKIDCTKPKASNVEFTLEELAQAEEIMAEASNPFEEDVNG